MSQQHQNRPKPGITFITGTDTGVGKTVFTAHAVFALRHAGRNALACKPFCSGGREDVEILFRAQGGALLLDQINPFCFSRPLCPLVAARAERQQITLPAVVRHVKGLSQSCDELLVEGAGGLLVPLGERYSALDLVKKLRCRVIVVAQNRLGTINHTLLTVDRLLKSGVRCAGVVLMETRVKDLSSASNYAVLKELLGKTPLVRFPCLGRNPASLRALKNNLKKIHKTLALLFP
jgi:dethiobiotin synthetase